jgi:hypothetical protein
VTSDRAEVHAGLRERSDPGQGHGPRQESLNIERLGIITILCQDLLLTEMKRDRFRDNRTENKLALSDD